MFQRETLIRKLLNKTAQNQYFYVKTELYPAVQCVKAKILLLLVGMFFVKHERWLPIFYDSKLRGSHKEVVLTHKKCHTLHKKMVALINCHFFSLSTFFLNFSSSCKVKVSIQGVAAIWGDTLLFQQISNRFVLQLNYFYYK